MNDKKLKQLNTLVLIAGAVCLVFIGYFMFAFKNNSQKKISAGELTSFNEDWFLRDYRGNADEFIELPAKIEAEAEETILIVKEAPSDVNSNSVLVLDTDFQNILVTIGDRRVYANGDFYDKQLLKSTVPCTNVIDISSAKPGDLISIYIVSAYKKYSGKINSISYGTAGDAYSSIIKRNGMSFVLALLLLIVSLILIISVCFIRNINVNKKRAIYGFSFILGVSIWTLLSSPIMQIISTNRFGLYMSDMILLMFMPILYIMHQRCFAIKRRYGKIFEIGIYIFAVNMLVGIIFQMFKICDFASYNIFTKSLIVIGLILLSGIMYLAADTYGDKSIYNNLVANGILTVAALIEAVLSIFKFYIPYDGVVMQVGVYIFMILLIVSIEKNIINEMNITKEITEGNLQTEKTKVLKKINTKMVYSALNVAVNNLKNKDAENSRLIYDTSVYLKYSIMAAAETKMVPFSQEMEYIKAYLGMQHMKNEMLELVVEDKVVDFEVPFNTVEPLVENALVNGALTAPLGGRLVVRSYERLDCFAIQIVDNGKGIGPDKKFEGKYSYKSIKKRLKAMCGAMVEVRNKPDKGTIVTVMVPKQGYIIKEN